MKHKHIALRALLWFICLYHVVSGLIPNLFPELLPMLAKQLAGMKIGAVPECIALARPLGVYAITFGIMMGVAAWNPVKNRALISVGIVLFSLRIAQRLLFLREAQEVFGVPLARSLVTVAVVSCFALALAWLRLLLYREMRAEKSDAAA